MKPCACPKTIKIMSRLGARHAAQMHRANAAHHPYDYTTRDWEIHMKEEETCGLFNLLDQLSGTKYWSNLLIKHHKIFRKQIKEYGKIDEKLMRQHSKLEEELIERYF